MVNRFSFYIFLFFFFMLSMLEHLESNLEASIEMAHPQARLKAITHLHAPHTQGESSAAPASSSLRQLFREDEASKSSAPARSSRMEDDHIHVRTQPRKSNSVLAKVKEKAKKWRSNFSKKKHRGDSNATPSPGVSLEREDAENENPEYLGAPMHESERAPDRYKETSKRHPRAISFIPENKVLDGNGMSMKHVHSVSSNLRAARAATKSVADNFPPALAPLEIRRTSIRTPKSAPAIVSLSPIMLSSHPSMPSPHAGTVIAPSLPTIATKQGELSPEAFCRVSPSSAPARLQTNHGRSTSTSKQIWDKGVSVKEYIMQKLEPGEDEKALSQVISEAISPRTKPDATVVEKVKNAVTSLLPNQESSSCHSVYHSAQNSLTHFPTSTYAYEVVEEETHGRILQAN